ncbi:MAG: adaptor protein MecA [Lachnospiraceae bacterium]|nr:adaptor protein MecA [Lachnospiraceae bacterium]
MKIERVDDKTIKCFLSNEELEEYEIDYKDFVMRSEKAKELVQEIVVLAEEQVGYKPPRFAFDLQIMVVPEQGLVLTFSEKDPLENLNSKDGEQLVECLKEMKKILQRTREKQIGEGQSAVSPQPDEAGKTKEPAENPARPEIAIFAFSGLNRITEYARVLPANLRVKSALYAMNDRYYLYMEKGNASYARYSRACIQALEFASLYSAEQEKAEYLKEYGECIIEEKALKKMRLD